MRKGYYFDERHQRYRVQVQETVNGRRLRRSQLLPKEVSEQEAAEIASPIRAEIVGKLANTTRHWEKAVERAKDVRGSWVWSLWDRARRRAKLKKRDFTLTIDDVAELCIRSKGLCEMTGVSLDHTAAAVAMRPFAPSLDRIDATKGYIDGNCRVVCVAVNLAMFTWGAEAFHKVAVGYVTNVLLCQTPTHHTHPQDTL